MILRRNKPSPSRGMSLVEVMVVVTLSSLVAGIAISMLVTLQRWDARLRDHGVRSDQWLRLAESLRTDIRRGEEVSLPSDRSLRVRLAEGGYVLYELMEAGCQRSIHAADDARPTRDLFAVGGAWEWTLENGPKGTRPLYVVALRSTAGRQEGESRRTPLLVHAALGADAAASEPGIQ
jgi:prepilin-type N-terminal cleavage/methylation domain-containing protein